MKTSPAVPNSITSSPLDSPGMSRFADRQTSFSSHVPPPETARFQERLRYIICTSQLLSEKVTPSLYPDLAPDEHLDLLLSKRKLRYWIGTGGCVIVVALFISWSLRDGSGTRQAKARNLAALALGLLIAVYLYAHTVLSHYLGTNCSDDGILACYAQGQYT